MRWNFHGLIIEGTTNDVALRERWQASFASLSEERTNAEPDLSFALTLVPSVSSVPVRTPQFRQAELLEYYLDGHAVVAHFPRFGQLRLDLARGTTEGRIVPDVLATYGVFEDLLAIGLSPHLRRRGLFLIHAFAAAAPPPLSSPPSNGGDRGEAVLLVGAIGSGKTTTGMALLNAGWKLLSNDSPIVNASADILSYPGLLAAYPDTLARFEATRQLSHTIPESEGRKKLTVAVESIWPNVWIERAPAGVILFPQIEPRANHTLEPCAPPEALRRLLPHAVEQWDRETIPEHLRVLRLLVERAPAYILRLGPDVSTIPASLATVMQDHGISSEVEATVRW